jgi:dihydroflavonol-4-reductase
MSSSTEALTVVTGASGFIGGVLVRCLLDQGRRVRAVDLTRGPGLEGLDLEFRSASVLDRAAITGAIDGASVVYHLAAVISVTGDPTGRVWATNVEGVRHTAEAALYSGVERFVHCSSIHAYDSTGVDLVDEDSPRAEFRDLPAYDRSKAAGEAALREVIAEGLNGVICNPTGVIGPGDYTRSRMNTVLLELTRGGLPALVGGGFDWVDVRDVASSLIAAEQLGRTGDNYLLPGHPLSVVGLAEVVEEVSGVARPSITVPMWLARLFGPLADRMARRSGSPLWYTSESLHTLRSYPMVSGAKAAAELGHHPRPIEDTIGDLYRWALGPEAAAASSELAKRREWARNVAKRAGVEQTPENAT